MKQEHETGWVLWEIFRCFRIQVHSFSFYLLCCCFCFSLCRDRYFVDFLWCFKEERENIQQKDKGEALRVISIVDTRVCVGMCRKKKKEKKNISQWNGTRACSMGKWRKLYTFPVYTSLKNVHTNEAAYFVNERRRERKSIKVGMISLWQALSSPRNANAYVSWAVSTS